MSQPQSYYKTQLKTQQVIVQQLYKQLTVLSSLRVLVFLVVALSVYFFFKHWQVVVTVIGFGSIVFIFLLTKYTNLKAKRELHKKLVTINEEELKIASGRFNHRPQGIEFQNPTHYYSLDIDLFGHGSFFQFINRTSTSEGKTELAKALTANTIIAIKKRQEAIKELSAKANWRQTYEATASLINVETPNSIILEWISTHKTFLPKAIKQIPLLFGIGSTAIFLLVFFKILDPSILGYWLLIGLAITGRYLKKINRLASNTDKVKDTFRQYASLLYQIENETFTSDLLKEKQQQTHSKNQKASKIVAQFSKHLDALDNRNNLISALFGNGLFLTDLKNSYNVEQWLKTYQHKVNDWFEVVSFFDAYNSLGNYTFNHPQYVFPEITDSKNAIKAESLGHPLLNPKKRIDNDLQIENEQFFIVTGANMAGKSTFLRTVSLHIVMANVGLPVCAKHSIYNPVKLITSMRTSDSLTDDSSYFFSELTRLKFIVDEIAKEPYFIVLDEILKGTNSTDKAIGSRKFVEKLVASNATGIIATHDLSLCDIEKELNEVKNYYFDAEIINDELHFDYTFKIGICKNMNASFLLKKMEIV
ncbi:MAG: DNA mismatch repair protein MutS [Gelidibacter sp.]|nr:DNA mismatch repair protein MutS [Gelidibacter sp.]